MPPNGGSDRPAVAKTTGMRFGGIKSYAKENVLTGKRLACIVVMGQHADLHDIHPMRPLWRLRSRSAVVFTLPKDQRR
jgi:hypothetical protein